MLVTFFFGLCGVVIGAFLGDPLLYGVVGLLEGGKGARLNYFKNIR